MLQKVHLLKEEALHLATESKGGHLMCILLLPYFVMWFPEKFYLYKVVLIGANGPLYIFYDYHIIILT